MAPLKQSSQSCLLRLRTFKNHSAILLSLSLSSDRRSFTIVLWVVFSLTSSFPAICYNITEHNVLCSVWLVPMCHQGAALVHIYLDGSVLLSHGGVESGQGLHTKMIQVCYWMRCFRHSVICSCTASCSAIFSDRESFITTCTSHSRIEVISYLYDIYTRMSDLLCVSICRNWTVWIIIVGSE